jgi:hypothetical protein
MGINLMLKSVLLTVRGLERSARCFRPIRSIVCGREGLIPHAPANVCRCCYEPEAACPGGVCRACLSVRTMGELDEQAILRVYEQEMLQP